ncbi:MAG: dTDP-glucose 4,6-dehydratase [Bacteriovorax sp.]|nr:dTDP-glucose 4,6-dehydratase [Bacteriovorax sp.]
MNILLTGAAGFIGSAFTRLALKNGNKVIALDKLTYAGHLENLNNISDKNFIFQKGCITDEHLVSQLLSKHEIDYVVNMAAESHVDNSISSPKEFIDTNIIGTYNLLNCSLQYYKTLSETKKLNFRYLQISTDEVFGTLGEEGKFNEDYPYQPNSPYSASKASGDHLVRAWFHTYKLPTIITNCSNNYGPRQFPEKLIPTVIMRALQLKSIPVYGNGYNIRDWIYVEDHCAGVYLALTKGTPGESYCFGGHNEISNIEVVKKICTYLDTARPLEGKKSYHELIEFVTDRLGHDWRYAIDDSKAQKELNYKRQFSSFDDGLASTIQWYFKNQEWIINVLKTKE